MPQVSSAARQRVGPRGHLRAARAWLPTTAIALACITTFSLFLTWTSVGQQALTTLGFILGWHRVALRQQQLVDAVQTALHSAGLQARMQLHGAPLPQRRGRESWQYRTYTLQLPAGVSADTVGTLLLRTTEALQYRLDAQPHHPSAVTTLTARLAGVPTTSFVITPAGRTPIHLFRVAIVIDDLGWDLEAARALLALNAPLSFAVLPNAPYRTFIAHEAQRRGRDVLLHMPMEPYHFPDVDPGHPVLLTTMSAGELARQIETALQDVPMAVGMNNHMGSRLTERRGAMQAIMRQLRRHRLFFLDSRTTRRSLGYQIAREMGVPTAQRQVFLDNDPNVTAIRRQLRHLVALAQTHGSAIGIGHPYAETIRALQIALPELKRHRIAIVPVSQLVH